MNASLPMRPMVSRRVAGATAVALAISAVAFAGPASACSCVTGSRMSMFERATDVFLGKVLEGPPVAAPHESSTSSAGWSASGVGQAEKRHFLIEVDETLKGNARGQIDVDTPGDAAACGYSFEVGKTYVVFAHRGMHGLHTDCCMGTVTGEGLNPTLEEARKLSEYAHTHRMPAAVTH